MCGQALCKTGEEEVAVGEVNGKGHGVKQEEEEEEGMKAAEEEAEKLARGEVTRLQGQTEA